MLRRKTKAPAAAEAKAETKEATPVAETTTEAEAPKEEAKVEAPVAEETPAVEAKEEAKEAPVAEDTKGDDDGAVEVAEENLKSIMCCLPNIDAPNLGYDNLFRVIIMQFIDAYNFDVRAIKKSLYSIASLSSGTKISTD